MMMELSLLIGKCEEEAKATKGRVFWEEVVLNTVESIRILECVCEFCQVMENSAFIHFFLRMRRW